MSRTKAGGDWREETLARMRALILEADPEMIEERTWRKPSNAMAGALSAVTKPGRRETHMPVTTEKPVSATAIRQFAEIEVHEAELEALRPRTTATRWFTYGQACLSPRGE